MRMKNNLGFAYKICCETGKVQCVQIVEDLNIKYGLISMDQKLLIE